MCNMCETVFGSVLYIFGGMYYPIEYSIDHPGIFFPQPYDI